MLVVKNKEKHIIVNRGHHVNRRRFTVAHELGRLRLHYKQGDEIYVDKIDGLPPIWTIPRLFTSSRYNNSSAREGGKLLRICFIDA